MILPGDGAKVRGSSALMRHLDGVALEGHVFLPEGQAAAGGDADLLVDQIDAGDRFRDRMLDLQARVHLDEIELAILVEELDRARAGIAEIGDSLGADRTDLVALGVEAGEPASSRPSGAGAAASSRARPDARHSPCRHREPGSRWRGFSRYFSM